jgi:chromosome segregation ATPase
VGLLAFTLVVTAINAVLVRGGTTPLLELLPSRGAPVLPSPGSAEDCDANLQACSNMLTNTDAQLSACSATTQHQLQQHQQCQQARGQDAHHCKLSLASIEQQESGCRSQIAELAAQCTLGLEANATQGLASARRYRQEQDAKLAALGAQLQAALHSIRTLEAEADSALSAASAAAVESSSMNAILAADQAAADACTLRLAAAASALRSCAPAGATAVQQLQGCEARQDACQERTVALAAGVASRLGVLLAQRSRLDQLRADLLRVSSTLESVGNEAAFANATASIQLLLSP